jgi:hypothetical protein
MKDPQKETESTEQQKTDQAVEIAEMELLEAELTVEPVESLGDILSRMIQEALEAHKRNGNPVAEWQDGKIVILPADDSKG